MLRFGHSSVANDVGCSISSGRHLTKFSTSVRCQFSKRSSFQAKPKSRQTPVVQFPLGKRLCRCSEEIITHSRSRELDRRNDTKSWLSVPPHHPAPGLLFLLKIRNEQAAANKGRAGSLIASHDNFNNIQFYSI